MSPFWRDLLLVAGGSATGGVLRWLLQRVLDAPGAMPWGTIAVNIAGCVVIGVVATACPRDWAKPLLMAGVLGGFTTFSAFALQTIQLAQAGRQAAALGNAGISLGACLLGCWVGVLIGTWIAAR